MSNNNTVSFDCRSKLLDFIDKLDLSKPSITNLLTKTLDGMDDDASKLALTETILKVKDFTSDDKTNTSQKHSLLELSTFNSSNDPDELIKDRFLCTKGGLLLVGPTGVGKSSLSTQLAINFSLGRTAFGLRPARPLKSLILQSENDSGDLAEMVQGVLGGLNLNDAQKLEASDKVTIYSNNTSGGIDVFTKVIEPMLAEHKPDLLIIDPVLGFLGGNVSDQELVGEWLRHGLAPLLKKHNCGAILCHHTKKQGILEEDNALDAAYASMGSVEWSNWARAILTIRKISGVPGNFKFTAAKRGTRLGWKDDNDDLTTEKYIAHSRSPGVIFWTETTLDNIASIKDSKSGKDIDNMLKLVPATNLISKDDLIKYCQKSGIGEKKAKSLINEAVVSKSLFEVDATRPGTAKKLLCRQPCPSVVLASLIQDSNGHYLVSCNSTPIPTIN